MCSAKALLLSVHNRRLRQIHNICQLSKTCPSKKSCDKDHTTQGFPLSVFHTTPYFNSWTGEKGLYCVLDQIL